MNIIKRVGPKFLILWVAQFISLLGSHMSSFALGIDFFNQTQSVFIYSLFPLFIFLPEIILAPILGVYIDRWNRKTAMIIGHSGSGFCMLIVMLIVYSGHYNISVILALIALSSMFNGFIFPAFSAATSQIVPEKELVRASAMLQFGFALVFIIGPSLGGYLLLSFGINFIFLLDVISFSVAILILSRTKIEHLKTLKKGNNGLVALRKEIVESVIYLSKEPLLIITLVIIGIANFNMGIINVLFTPLVLGVSNSSVLGVVLSIAGLGFLLGSVSLMLIGDLKGRIQLLFVLGIVQGGVFLLVFFTASIVLIAIGAFVFMVCMGLIGGLNMAIWQQKVPHEIQGRVFSFRTLVVGGIMLLGFLSSGLLTESLFVPMLKSKSFVIKFMVDLIGKSPYPQIEALLLLLGVGTIISLVLIYFILRYKHKRIFILDK